MISELTNRIIRSVLRLNKKKWRNDYDDMLHQESAAEKFRLIYEKNLWRNAESVSGSGSTLKFTKNIREALPGVIAQYDIHSMFDAPCGDFNWMKHVLKTVDIRYIGGDIVEDLIARNNKIFATENVEFVSIDLIREHFPAVDMMLCRDCLFHMSYENTLEILNNFIDSNIEYFFTTTYKKPADFVNGDIVTGSFRAIDLTKAPYHFPDDALFAVLDGKKDNTERFMCLWNREQVKSAVAAMSKALKQQETDEGADSGKS